MSSAKRSKQEKEEITEVSSGENNRRVLDEHQNDHDMALSSVNQGDSSLLSEKKRLATRTRRRRREEGRASNTPSSKSKSRQESIMSEKRRLATRGAVSTNTSSSSSQGRAESMSGKPTTTTTRRSKMAGASAAAAATATSLSSQEGDDSILSEKRQIASRGAHGTATRASQATAVPASTTQGESVLMEKRQIASRGRKGAASADNEQESAVAALEQAMVPGAVAVTQMLDDDQQEPLLAGDNDEGATDSTSPPQDVPLSSADTVGDMDNVGKELVTAFAVGEGDVDDGKVVATAEPINKTKRRLMIGCLLFVVITTVVVAAVVATRPNDANDIPTDAPSLVPSASPSFAPGGLEALLVSRSLDGGQSLLDESSPQYQALDWLSRNLYLNQYSDMRILQRYVLATMFFALSGEDWLSSEEWMSLETNECDWFFSSESPCNEEGEVVEISLIANFLFGELPEEVAMLPELQIIDLTGNLLSGAIPSTVGLMTSLKSLVLSSNALTEIPSELGQLESLGTLRLNSNLFEDLPLELGLGNLTIFSLSNNDIFGLVPSGLLGPRLQTFDISNTFLGIEVASEIGKMTSLIDLRMNGVSVFQGDFPGTELGLLTNLVNADLSTFSGGRVLPTELGLLTKMESFTMAESYIGGTLPSELGSWQSLIRLDLSTHLFVGSVPTEFQRLTALKKLNLSPDGLERGLEGSLSFLEQLTNLQELYLGWNSFNGTLPGDTLRVLTNLRYLDLGDCEFEASDGPLFPSTLGELRSIEEMILGNENLHGYIPSEIGQWKSIRSLELRGFITGTVPSEIGVLSDLEDLSFTNSPFSVPQNKGNWSLPTEIGNMVSLTKVELCCSLSETSSLPSEVGSLTRLEELVLGLEAGTLPSSLGRLQNVKVLAFTGEGIGGTLPTELAFLPSLTELHVDGTSISGTVPEGLCELVESGQLSKFEADCEEVNCTCCTRCCTNGRSCVSTQLANDDWFF